MKQYLQFFEYEHLPPNLQAVSKVSVLKRGRAWVTVEEAVTPLSPVFVRFATDGGQLYTVQRMMRHQSPAMTARYAHLAGDYLADAAERLCTQPARKDGSRHKIVGPGPLTDAPT